MDVVDFIGHYQKSEFFVTRVEWDKSQVMDLYDDFNEKGSLHGIPKYFVLKYHPPNKEKQLKVLETDADFAKMRGYWENDGSGIVHLFLKPLTKPSKPQITLECLAKLKQSNSNLLQNQITAQPRQEIEPLIEGEATGSQPSSSRKNPKVIGIVRDTFGIKHALPVQDDEMSLSQAKTWASELILSQPDGGSQTLFQNEKHMTPKKPTKDLTPTVDAC